VSISCKQCGIVVFGSNLCVGCRTQLAELQSTMNSLGLGDIVSPLKYEYGPIGTLRQDLAQCNRALARLARKLKSRLAQDKSLREKLRRMDPPDMLEALARMMRDETD
jgi:hypothetical protein